MSPENIRVARGSARCALGKGPCEDGDLGSNTFENAVESNECLCRFYTGEKLGRDPRLDQNRPRPGVFDWEYWKNLMK